MESLKRCLHELAHGNPPKVGTEFNADAVGDTTDTPWSQHCLLDMANRTLAMGRQPKSQEDDVFSGFDRYAKRGGEPVQMRDGPILFMGWVTDEDAGNHPFTAYVFRQTHPASYNTTYFSITSGDLAATPHPE